MHSWLEQELTHILFLSFRKLKTEETWGKVVCNMNDGRIREGKIRRKLLAFVVRFSRLRGVEPRSYRDAASCEFFTIDGI